MHSKLNTDEHIFLFCTVLPNQLIEFDTVMIVTTFCARTALSSERARHNIAVRLQWKISGESSIDGTGNRKASSDSFGIDLVCED